MPLKPKAEDAPRIRSALTFYKVCSIITGVMLLLLCAEMILKYAFGLEMFVFGPRGLLTFDPTIATADGLESTGEGFNLSTGILIAHGWFYVVYLFADFRLWSLMRWPFWKFLLIAGGGVVPFLSFFLEAIIARQVDRHLAENPAPAPVAAEAAS